MEHKLKPCIKCGQMPKVFGREVRDYVDGEWSKFTRRYYWVQPFCHVSCPVGNDYSKKYGVVGGPGYKTEEDAIRAWNDKNGGNDE